VYAGFDDITPSLLQKKIDWFKTIIEQRIEPHTKLVILHTRWHSEDLQGYLKDNYPDDYEFLEFPAIDENGQPLWPQRYSIDDYRKKQEAMGERQFQAIYQQQPLDLTSDFFYMDHLIFEDQFDDYAIAKCRSWDIASSDDKLGDQRDYTVGVRMCKTGNGQYWIFDYERGQYGNDVLHIIKQTAKLDTPNHKILLETGTKGGASGLLFNDYKKALPGYSTIQSDPTAMTKADRATPLRHAIYDGLVHVLIRNDNRRQAFIDEFKAFPNSKHDDIVDAVAHGFNYLKQYGGNNVKTAGKRQRKRLR
jgi:phage terminase large subunit-like protein